MEVKNKDSPIIYICSPYSGDIARNTDLACMFSRFAVEKGYVPITPHLLLPNFLSEETEREIALSLGLRLMDACSELWVCGSVFSPGMKQEITYATENGIPIRYVKEEELYVRN